MPFEVYDFREVNKNVLTTPEIRARLYHMEPGQVDRLHSHDLGHEIFLILEGKAEFMIAGHTEVLEAGQLCIALADEIHQVRNLLPRPPHRHVPVGDPPTSSPPTPGRDPDGSVHPPQFRTNTFYDDVDDTRPSRRPARRPSCATPKPSPPKPARPPLPTPNKPKTGAWPTLPKTRMQP